MRPNLVYPIYVYVCDCPSLPPSLLSVITGEYSAVPPPLAIEGTKGKAHLIKKTSKKKGEDSKKKEQAFTKRPSSKFHK